MSKTRWLVYDDSDPLIDYQGSWFIVQDTFAGSEYGSYGPTYGGSQHGTNGTASLSFPFTGKHAIFAFPAANSERHEGSSIRVYGSSNVLNVSNSLDPQWECFVDGTSIGIERPWTSWQNNYPLCSTYNQTFGRHTLTLNVSAANERTFYVDSIRFLPLANLTSELDHATVVIDQLDSSITYTPPDDWQPMQETPEVILTLQPGASMSVNFTGSKVTWMGWTPNGYPTGQSTAQYQLDDAEPITVSLRGLPAGATSQFNQPFFETPTVDKGNHRLTVTHMGNSAPLVLDFLLVEDGDIIFGSTDTASSTSSSRPTVTNANLPGSSSGAANAASKKSPVGAIVGGVVGGVALITLLLLGLFFLRRRRTSSRGLSPSQLPTKAHTMHQTVSSYGPSHPSAGTPIIQEAAFMAPLSTGHGSTTTKTSYMDQPTLFSAPSRAYDDGSDYAHPPPQRLEPVRRNSPSPAPVSSHSRPAMFVTPATPGGTVIDWSATPSFNAVPATGGSTNAQGTPTFRGRGIHIPNSPNVIY
ncbi:hypothetical protein NMY22_g9690 [Coprinellus aureogranulatus]|nr:hypothetical protein NMY22_g9690 [Coprinellus aureogranulatus]